MSVPDGAVVVYSSHLPLEVHLVRGALEAQGMPAMIINEHLAGMGAELGFANTRAEVIVPEDRAREALEFIGALPRAEDGRLSLLDEAAGNVALVDEPAKCPACGEEWEPGFEVCWSCEHELAELAPQAD